MASSLADVRAKIISLLEGNAALCTLLGTDAQGGRPIYLDFPHRAPNTPCLVLSMIDTFDPAPPLSEPSRHVFRLDLSIYSASTETNDEILEQCRYALDYDTDHKKLGPWGLDNYVLHAIDYLGSHAIRMADTGYEQRVSVWDVLAGER